jgi:hypothetical protein
LLVEVSHWPVWPPACAGQSALLQQSVAAMHLPPHFFPVPQVKSQTPAVQVAVAPVGAVHGSHEPPQ